MSSTLKQEDIVLYNFAIDYAKKLHEFQVDKSLVNYLDHVFQVACCFRREELYERSLSILHDVIEDYSDHVTNQSIIDGTMKLMSSIPNMPEGFVDKLLLLTHNRDDSYEEYIQKIIDSGHIDVMRVKYYDLLNNLDCSRVKEESSKYMRRLEKYSNAIHMIEKAFKEKINCIPDVYNPRAFLNFEINKEERIWRKKQ